LKQLFIFCLTYISLCTNLSAWDYSYRANALYSITNNVKYVAEKEKSDHFQTVMISGQMKNENYKIKLKGKVEKYNRQKTSDFYATDLNVQYKTTPTSDLNVGANKLGFYHKPKNTTEKRDDNSGLGYHLEKYFNLITKNQLLFH
jgi:hypothetical protein